MPSHVAHISFFSDPLERRPAQLLVDWPSLVDVAEAVRGAGVRVSVLQACASSARIERNGVDYHFLPFGRGARAGAAEDAFARLVRDLAPDVCHVHGLGFPHDVLALSKLAPAIPIVLQDHAGKPPRPWRRSVWRRALSNVAAVSFCSHAQARPFLDSGLIADGTRICEIPESTSRFTPGSRTEARRVMGVDGEPLALWVGHLDANKDPLTVLDGISLASRALPRLKLCCCFGTAPLMREVQAKITSDPNLRDRVVLVGRMPHDAVEQLMRAADVFVLGSHREGSGYALIEALASGLPPAVTDIPSFRALTGSGTVGALWPCGDARALCEAVIEVSRRPKEETREAVRAHFDAELSFEALGRKLRAMYEDVLTAQRAGLREQSARARGRS